MHPIGFVVVAMAAFLSGISWFVGGKLDQPTSMTIVFLWMGSLMFLMIPNQKPRKRAELSTTLNIDHLFPTTSHIRQTDNEKDVESRWR